MGRNLVVVHRLEEAVVVRAEVELHLRGFRARRVEGCLHPGSVVLEVATLLVELFALEVHLREGLGRHEHSTEVLVLEGNPIHLSRHAFLFGFGLGEFLRVVAVNLVGERGVHILEVKSLFVLGHTVFPINLQRLCG